MKLDISRLRTKLARGDLEGAWRRIEPQIMSLPAEKRPEAAKNMADDLVWEFGDIEPVSIELLIGRLYLSSGLEEEGRQTLRRAARWKKAKERAERELGLDFGDQTALYKFLGANDFREYTEKNNPQRSRDAKLLLDKNTVTYLFHTQQMEKCLPLLEHFPGASWLTLGDGRMAFEARFLQEHGARAFPTNLDPTLLEECRELGVIGDYGVENMEELSFADKSFEFVCCKDSLHHCLFPYRALYEMLRVARTGIYMVEPFDHGFNASPIYGTRVGGFHHFEEEPGNYAYLFSERELEKLCVSHGWRCLATRGMCNIEENGISGESTDPEDWKKHRQRVEEMEKLARENKLAYRYLGSILLRETPTAALRESLRGMGFAVTDLPFNPFTRRAVLNSLDILYSRKQ